uniref:Uncharacterized protein n=1 Tax=Romanomermis culicivorax TaxID=13658 RepID=A0A915HTF1_ROMCU
MQKTIQPSNAQNRIFSYRFNICAPDSVIQGKVAIGGPCDHGVQCFTNFCFNHQCVLRKFFGSYGNKTGGTHCSFSRECFSNYCHMDKAAGSSSTCAPESPMPGKVAGGGPCCRDTNCFSEGVSEIRSLKRFVKNSL